MRAGSSIARKMAVAGSVMYPWRNSLKSCKIHFRNLQDPHIQLASANSHEGPRKSIRDFSDLVQYVTRRFILVANANSAAARPPITSLICSMKILLSKARAMPGDQLGIEPISYALIASHGSNQGLDTRFLKKAPVTPSTTVSTTPPRPVTSNGQSQL